MPLTLASVRAGRESSLALSNSLAWAPVNLRYHDTSNVPAQISPVEPADLRVVL